MSYKDFKKSSTCGIILCKRKCVHRTYKKYGTKQTNFCESCYRAYKMGYNTAMVREFKKKQK